MSQMYSRRPSEIFGITDPYTAYCLDEACAVIKNKIDAGEEPIFRRKVKSFKELYGSIT